MIRMSKFIIMSLKGISYLFYLIISYFLIVSSYDCHHRLCTQPTFLTQKTLTISFADVHEVSLLSLMWTFPSVDSFLSPVILHVSLGNTFILLHY